MARRWDRFARRDSYGAIVTRKQPWESEAFLASGRDLAAYTLDWVGAQVTQRRMLEIGCGVGRTAMHFAASFAHVDGVDPREMGFDPPIIPISSPPKTGRRHLCSLARACWSYTPTDTVFSAARRIFTHVSARIRLCRAR